MTKKHPHIKGEVSTYLDKNHGIIVECVFDGNKWVDCLTEEYKTIIASFKKGNQS